MRYGPPVAFVRRPDGHRLAYQVLGDGPVDLVLLLGVPTHLGLLTPVSGSLTLIT